MGDSPYTFFFLGASVVLCVALGYGEMAWLRKTAQFSVIWGSVVTTAAVNFLFLVVFYFFATSQGIVMIFPVPVVPAIYLVVKLGLYFVIGKIYAVEELKYFIDQGLDLKLHARMIHSVINNQPLNEQGIVDEAGIKQMISKIQLLLGHGADINAPDQYGFNPIFTTVRQGVDLAPVLDFIASNGATLDGQSDLKLYPHNEAEIPEGVTALMMTVALGKGNETKVLLKHGARKDVKDVNGDTAYDYAVKRDASDEIKMLLK